ncbi:40s ribosomal protein s12 [Colletotrichum incanum]|uniref:40S ribosomal protein S12 n=1 Tax=Colletotrichum incanum TaxID=1573173 RepID=A0A167AP33_COLIC|nr:40s ribosomal protein s12 [Colletotrichum incanum]
MLAFRGLLSVESALPGEHQPRGGFCQLIAEEESVSEIIVVGGVEQSSALRTEGPSLRIVRQGHRGRKSNRILGIRTTRLIALLRHQGKGKNSCLDQVAIAAHMFCSYLPRGMNGAGEGWIGKLVGSNRQELDRKTFKMSDVEENNAPEVAEEVEVSADAGSKGQMSVLDALKGVLKLALMHDGLARGLREASKALDRRQAHMCVLNEACEEEAYKKLVIALCSEHKIPLIKVPDGKQLGEWAGLCVLDREGNARKVVNCSCVVVKDWGEESQERSILLNYFQTEQ